VSLESSTLCVVDRGGKIVREAVVSSEPQTLLSWFRRLGLDLSQMGLEAGPLSQWLYAELKQAGLAVELLETRHVKAAVASSPVNTDCNDARMITNLMRLGWFRSMHCKSLGAQETRALLGARKLVQSKLYDVKMSLRGMLRGFGLKVGRTTPRSFGARILELVDGQATLEAIAKALLCPHKTMLRELSELEKRVRRPGPAGRAGAAAHDRAGRRGDRGADLCFGHRRPREVQFDPASHVGRWRKLQARRGQGSCGNGCVRRRKPADSGGLKNRLPEALSLAGTTANSDRKSLSTLRRTFVLPAASAEVDADRHTVSHIQIRDTERILLNEPPPWLDNIAHELHRNLVCPDEILDPQLQERERMSPSHGRKAMAVDLQPFNEAQGAARIVPDDHVADADEIQSRLSREDELHLSACSAIDR
jgi:hypothetical protein